MHPQVRQQGSGGSEAQLSTEVKAIRPCFHHLVHRLRFIFGVLLFGETITKIVMIYVNKCFLKINFKTTIIVLITSVAFIIACEKQAQFNCNSEYIISKNRCIEGK